MSFISTELLDTFESNGVKLTLVKINRDDQFGKWSEIQVGHWLQPENPGFNKTDQMRNFSIIEARLPLRIHWEVSKKMVQKNKKPSQINDLLNFLEDKHWIWIYGEKN